VDGEEEEEEEAGGGGKDGGREGTRGAAGVGLECVSEPAKEGEPRASANRNTPTVQVRFGFI
jgi:hypothetical protein